jgi:hypothetical protein
MEQQEIYNIFIEDRKEEIKKRSHLWTNILLSLHLANLNNYFKYPSLDM